MTPRERVLSVLAGQQSDQVPFDIWYTPEIKKQLLDYYQITDEQEVWRHLEIDKIVWVAGFEPLPIARMDRMKRWSRILC